ncbi:alpha/beta hydrolase [Streptomyces sp. NPDC002120]|uniref:alpha/beta hydrolase n=1 Tax=Streptomyces sp. NPDC002120 TaxID=3364631 RepID=UPI0036BBF4CF
MATETMSKDHYVDHKSTIPANADDIVKLFVRERRPTTGPRKPVLMLHGRSVPALAGFDPPNKKYSWAEQLAKAGYDVFVMELQGSGLSTRPKVMDQPLNVSPAQRPLLSPNPIPPADLPAPDAPAQYPFQLNNSKSDWEEVDTVVEYIRKEIGQPTAKIDLIGWSAAAQQLGPYTIQHADKVKSLFLVAPIFPPNGRASKENTDFGAPVNMPVGTPAAAFGYPMSVTSKNGLAASWARDLKCPDQRENGVLDEVWKAIQDVDALGATWGGPTSGAPTGFIRVRNSFWWGWNSKTVPLHNILGQTVPVCLVYGEHDSIVNTAPDLGLLYFSVPELYRLIPGKKKLMIRLACAGHQIVWERAASHLHAMSEEWLKNGKVFGEKGGSFHRDEDGVLTSLE